MRKHTTYSLILSALLLLPMLTACVSEGMEPCPAETVQEAPGYLRLSVSSATGRDTRADTRANPGTGEWGDGPEHGRGNENKIHDLCLFLYADGGLGLDGAYRVLWSKYVDGETIKVNTENANPDYNLDHIYNVVVPLTDTDLGIFANSKSGTLRFLTIANAGDVTSMYGGYMINSICRDIPTVDAWKPTAGRPASESDRFLMSSAFNGAKRSDAHKDDSRVFATSGTGGTISTEYSCDITIERVAARIDLRVKAENITADNKLTYTVDANTTYPDNRSHNTLTLLNAIPVNLMADRSYMVKQLVNTVEATESDWFTAADETVDGSGYPTNYVRTPDFRLKGTDKQTLGTWYGTSAASWLRAGENRATLANMSELTPLVVGSNMPITSETTTDRAIVLAYSNENTHPASLQLTTETTHPSDYITGLLFRAQYHPAILYTDGRLTPSVEGYTDGQDFWLFRTVSDKVQESTNLYFKTKEALDAYVTTLPAGGKYETLHYPGGICYYNIWIKHGNIDADPEQNFPMKWGIVRNNIYRVALNFLGVGQPTPEIREPYAVTSRIYVIKWNFRPQPEIIM